MNGGARTSGTCKAGVPITQISCIILGRIGIPVGLISQPSQVRFLPPELLRLEVMEKEDKVIQCVVGQTVRSVLSQANELKIQKGEIIDMFVHDRQVYLVYYR